MTIISLLPESLITYENHISNFKSICEGVKKTSSFPMSHLSSPRKVLYLTLPVCDVTRPAHTVSKNGRRGPQSIGTLHKGTYNLTIKSLLVF